MKHTKGPWFVQVEKLSNGDSRTHIRGDAMGDGSMGLHICTINPRVNALTDNANARLIAAAPELLDFVRGVYIDQLGHGPSADEVILNKARELIFKITGEV
jgi:hypothetical protein